MAGRCLQAASIGERAVPHRAGAPPIRFHDGERKTWVDHVRALATRLDKTSSVPTALRVLILIGLLASLFFLFYRRLRPYLRSIHEFIHTVRHFQKVTRESSVPGAHQPEKLIQCQTCGTWVPQTRALSANSLAYCSQECLQQQASNKRKKKVS